MDNMQTAHKPKVADLIENKSMAPSEPEFFKELITGRPVEFMVGSVEVE
jgi:hypothetical protein